MTQNALILSALQRGQKLTPLDALQQFGCFRLGARIYDLKQAGHPIAKRMVVTPSGAMVAEYRLEAGK